MSVLKVSVFCRFNRFCHLFLCRSKTCRDSCRGNTSEAYGLTKKLWDRAFLQLLEFFSLLMPEVDVLYNTLQKRSIDAPGKRICGSKPMNWPPSLMMEQTSQADEKEACDTVISQVEQRVSE